MKSIEAMRCVYLLPTIKPKYLILFKNSFFVQQKSIVTFFIAFKGRLEKGFSVDPICKLKISAESEFKKN